MTWLLLGVLAVEAAVAIWAFHRQMRRMGKPEAQIRARGMK